MNNKKFILILISIIVLSYCVLIFPQLIKYKGMLLKDVGVNNGYSYAYGANKDYGLYRKSLSGGNYEKISEEPPLSYNYVYFDNDEIYYSSTSYSLVKLNLNTLESNIIHSSFRSYKLLGVNERFLIAEDVKGDSAIVIIDIDTLQTIKVINLNPQNLKITNDKLEFIDFKTQKSYEYYFIDDQLKELNE